MHPSPSSVCSIDLKTRTSMCQSFHATGHSCSLRSKDISISVQVLPFGLSLSPCVFTKVVEAALVPLREQGVRILNYLDDWLILAQSQDQLCEQVSEAPGAYGGCSGGHTAGAAPYETASTLAPWPSPEVGVAERHAACPSHSSLPTNLHPVVRPFIPSGRSAPGTGLQARCGLHGCLRQGLGGHVQRACSVGGLDGSPTALAYQLPRVSGSTPGLEPSQETLTRRARTGEHILVRTDSTATVAYINQQGALRSRRMSQLARHLLLWSRKYLRSLRAIHIPGLLNRTADELSRAALPGEWRLHPQTV